MIALPPSARNNLILLPFPRLLRYASGVNPGTRLRTRVVDIGRNEADAYRLTITPDTVLIEASGEAGLFYGRQTLEQIRKQSPGVLPCLKILDWPDYPVRGFYHDVTRGKVPKLKTLLALADKCAHYKLNQLHLYIEHTYAYKKHPEVWEGADPLTADEIRTLDAHCAKLQIDLVPSFSTFGHFYGFIHTKKFQHLNELDRDVSGEPFTWWDRMQHYTLDCQNPESIALVREIIAEVRPLFRSKYFNLCGDETFDLGKGKNKERAEKFGKGRLYIDFLTQIMAAVRKADAIPMFWGDVVGHHPELLSEIPKDAIALDWDYSAKLTSSIAPLVQESGLSYYVCPGVCGWNKGVNDYRTAHRNITRFAKLGKKHEAVGLLNTDWGDFGHINALGLSLPGLILGAAAAWNTNSSTLAEAKFEKAISHYELGDPTGRLLGLLREASSASRATWQMIVFWQQPHSKDMLGDWFHPRTGVPNGLLKYPYRKHLKALSEIKRLTSKIELLLKKSTPIDSFVNNEIRTGLLALRVFEEIHLLLQARITKPKVAPPSAKSVASRILALEKLIGCEWLKRNKPSEYFRIREVLLGCARDLVSRKNLIRETR